MATDAKADLQVELVAADRVVWSGRASMVLARTTEGDVGILRDHSPVLSVLVPGVIEIKPEDGDRVVAVVDGGFLSVAANRVSILAERTTLSGDVDLSAAQADLEAARGEDGDDAERRVRHAEALIRAAEGSS
ncbi:MAG: F0F1 ATP synthase subunit epsilon [Nocardioides sp.]